MDPLKKTDLLRIGEVADRAGLATSALRFYEDQRLIESQREADGVRRYPRSILRRIAFIQAAQRVGLSLEEIKESLDSLPNARTPTRADWARLAKGWKPRIEGKIQELQSLKDDLADCIGCGCLSLRECSLYNRQDKVAARGTGARLWKASADYDPEAKAAARVRAASKDRVADQPWNDLDRVRP